MIARDGPGYGGMMERRGWTDVGTTGRPGHAEGSDVREARPLSLQIDRDKEKTGLLS